MRTLSGVVLFLIAICFAGDAVSGVRVRQATQTRSIDPTPSGNEQGDDHEEKGNTKKGVFRLTGVRTSPKREVAEDSQSTEFKPVSFAEAFPPPKDKFQTVTKLKMHCVSQVGGPAYDADIAVTRTRFGDKIQTNVGLLNIPADKPFNQNPQAIWEMKDDFFSVDVKAKSKARFIRYKGKLQLPDATNPKPTMVMYQMFPLGSNARWNCEGVEGSSSTRENLPYQPPGAGIDLKKAEKISFEELAKHPERIVFICPSQDMYGQPDIHAQPPYYTMIYSNYRDKTYAFGPDEHTSKRFDVRRYGSTVSRAVGSLDDTSGQMLLKPKEGFSPDEKKNFSLRKIQVGENSRLVLTDGMGSCFQSEYQ